MERYSLNHLFRTLGCFLLCVMFTATAFAQQKTIKGTVVDVTGEPLIGVNVAVKGTTIGIITDIDGNYTLEVPSKSTIVFSYIGYQAQEVPVGNQSTINVTLKEDTQKLEEVVVVGYGTQKKVTVTGSVASVSGEELKASPTTNLSNGMVGRMPGVIGFQKSDEPGGGGTTIRVRGTNSLGSNDPLVVIDGIPDRDGGFNRLNPTEIESISVLKDASAAIYGARAANGVILITTKRGKEGKATVTFNASGGFSQPTRLPKMANAFEYATMVNEINPGTWTDEDLRLFQDGSDPWGHPDTDWFDTTIKNASPMYRADVGVQGGSEKMKYYVNFAANGEDGIYKNSANRYDQYSLRMNLDINTSKYVSFQLGSIARLENTKYPMKSASSIFSGIRRGKPTQNAYWPTGEPGPDLERGDNPAVTSTDIAGFDNQKNYYIQNNLSVNIKIPWIEGLTIRGNGSYDKHFYNRKKFEKPILLYSWDGVNKNSSGLTAAKRYVDNAQLSREHSDATSWMVNGLIDYNRTFGQHNLGVTFGIEAQKKDYDFTSAFRQGFISDTKPELNLGSDVGMKNTGYSWEEARLNYFGRVSYNYLERYLFEFVWRADGSYRFPKNKRYGFFPGASVAWRVSEENWWKENVRFIDYFKLRASISQTGNDALLNSDNEYDRSIQYLNTYGITEHGVVFGGEESKRLYAVRTPNPNITWEVGTTYNVGLDFKFLQNRLSVETDAFYHKRTNMLISRNASLSEITGITLPRENIGEMKNRGFDMLVGWNDNIGDVQYNVSLNATYARNKILFWDETPGAPAWQVSTGLPVSTSLYYVADGIFHNQAEIDAYPHWEGAQPGDIRFKDINNDGKIDADDRIRSDKNKEPRFVAGLTLGLNWKNWDLMALFQGATGGQVYIQTWSGTIGNFLKEYYDQRWTPDNPTANGPRTYEREDQYWISNKNTYFLRKGDYLRLKNVELGYTFSVDALKKAGISKLRIYGDATNLFTLDHVKVADPEARDVNLEAYPQRRIINFGVQATF
ncbi:SusC/RagA family TonB-linked outer membrane protein [Parabacteroides johnsonii]|uniref:SusC/RagA family TonB-linked outer membrane protein n=1 Tax=Parabacteroides johnsonii TaxID=387661 RepID=UPI003517FD5E